MEWFLCHYIKRNTPCFEGKSLQKIILHFKLKNALRKQNYVQKKRNSLFSVPKTEQGTAL